MYSQLLPYIQAFKVQTFTDANVCSHIRSRMLVHVSGGLRRPCASSAGDCALPCLAAQDRIESSDAVSLFLAVCSVPAPVCHILRCCIFQGACMRAQSLHSCLILGVATDCSPPGSSVHGILQARILEWVTMPSSRRSSRPTDRAWVSCMAVDSLPLSYQGSPSFQGSIL